MGRFSYSHKIKPEAEVGLTLDLAEAAVYDAEAQ